VNVHAKSHLILEPLRALRPETKGQARACPDWTRAMPCKVQVGLLPDGQCQVDSNGDSNSSDQRQAATTGDSTQHSHDPCRLGICPDGRGSVPLGSDCCQYCCQAAGQRLSRADNSGMSAQHTDCDGRSWTMCLLLRIRRLGVRAAFFEVITSARQSTNLGERIGGSCADILGQRMTRPKYLLAVGQDRLIHRDRFT